MSRLASRGYNEGAANESQQKLQPQHEWIACGLLYSKYVAKFHTLYLHCPPTMAGGVYGQPERQTD
eukprot:scaffold601494_cov37-Prasinocladus_malaysianus.AAC.1